MAEEKKGVASGKYQPTPVPKPRVGRSVPFVPGAKLVSQTEEEKPGIRGPAHERYGIPGVKPDEEVWQSMPVRPVLQPSPWELYATIKANFDDVAISVYSGQEDTYYKILQVASTTVAKVGQSGHMQPLIWTAHPTSYLYASHYGSYVDVLLAADMNWDVERPEDALVPLYGNKDRPDMGMMRVKLGANALICDKGARYLYENDFPFAVFVPDDRPVLFVNRHGKWTFQLLPQFLATPEVSLCLSRDRRLLLGAVRASDGWTIRGYGLDNGFEPMEPTVSIDKLFAQSSFGGRKPAAVKRVHMLDVGFFSFAFAVEFEGEEEETAYLGVISFDDWMMRTYVVMRTFVKLGQIDLRAPDFRAMVDDTGDRVLLKTTDGVYLCEQGQMFDLRIAKDEKGDSPQRGGRSAQISEGRLSVLKSSLGDAIWTKRYTSIILGPDGKQVSSPDKPVSDPFEHLRKDQTLTLKLYSDYHLEKYATELSSVDPLTDALTRTVYLGSMGYPRQMMIQKVVSPPESFIRPQLLHCVSMDSQKRAKEVRSGAICSNCGADENRITYYCPCGKVFYCSFQCVKENSGFQNHVSRFHSGEESVVEEGGERGGSYCGIQ